MPAVKIDSGEPEAANRPHEIPKTKWRSLMWVKRTFAAVRINYDCRCLLEFVQDAEIMWEELGFKSADDMIENGYELEPEEVRLALDWLRIKDPKEAVKYETAVKSGTEVRNAKIFELADQGLTQEAIAKEVGISRSRVTQILLGKSENAQKANITQTDKAKQSGISRRTQVKIDKIRKIDPVLADRCEDKQVKVAQAERDVGLAPNRVDLLVKAFKKLSPVERAEFLKHINL